MSLLSSAATTLARVNATVEKRIMSLSEFDRLLDQQYYGIPSASGQYVTVDSALTTSAVWACVQAISKAISALPCHLFKWQAAGGKIKLYDHRVANILESPNDEQTPLEFWETLVTHRLIYGNGYAQIVLDGHGALELWILDPAKMSVRRNATTRALDYVYKLDPSKPTTFAFGEIFHLKGRSLDGITGLSPISYARQTIGLALAAEDYGAGWFGRGSIPGGFLSTPSKLSEISAKRLKKDWDEAHGGTNRAHGVAVLEGDLTWTQVSIPPEDAQFLETRKATREDIASWFGVPPHKIGLISSSTRATIEEQNIEWVAETIRPECRRIEEAIQRDLIAIGDGKRGVFAQFDLTDLLRGNLTAQTQYFVNGRQWGWMNVDEIRDRLGMNPLPDGQGKTYITPLNMVPVDQNGVPTAPEIPLAVPDDGKDEPPPEAMPAKDGQKSNGHTKDLRQLVTLAGGRYS